jgi:VWFA-related protein
LIGSIAALSGLVVRAGVQQPVATFKSSVELVPISAVVRDGRNRLVLNLNADDFLIVDGGIRRRIVDFHRDQTSPISVALLLDVSGSMKIGPKLAFAREVLDRLTEQFEAGRDEAGLFTFDAALHELQPFTHHPSDIGALFDGVEPFGTTSLYDAIASTARLLMARPPQRRAIIVFTDGVDTSSRLSPGEVSALASSIDVPVYIVVAVPPIDQAPIAAHAADANRPGADLRDLAQWTGGDLRFATTTAQADATAREIVMELRHQYLIAIEASDRPEWRQLEVRVRDRHFTVRARAGYFGRDLSSSK